MAEVDGSDDGYLSFRPFLTFWAVNNGGTKKKKPSTKSEQDGGFKSLPVNYQGCTPWKFNIAPKSS